jgi:hypothetical protein
LLWSSAAQGAELGENPSESPGSKLVLEAIPEWNVGGLDDEEILFGVLSGMDLDSQGNVYVSTANSPRSRSSPRAGNSWAT